MKNDGTFFLATYDGKVCPPTVYPFRWKGIQFFSHKAFIAKDDFTGSWKVSEKSTGRGVTWVKNSRSAPAETRAFLEQVGVEKLKREITQLMEMDKGR